jgi:hypothetical protein
MGNPLWVCWDFHELRIGPTYYTIVNGMMRSWVIEGSVDGEKWTEMDRQTETIGGTSFDVGDIMSRIRRNAVSFD